MSGLTKDSINHINHWLDSMKIALVEKDGERAFELTQNLPFSTFASELHSLKHQKDNKAKDDKIQVIEEIESKDSQDYILEYLNTAKELISQAIDLLHENKKHTKEQMDRIRQAKAFFE